MKPINSIKGFIRQPLAHSIMLYFILLLTFIAILLSPNLIMVKQLKRNLTEKKIYQKRLCHEQKLSLFLLNKKNNWPLILQRKVISLMTLSEAKLNFITSMQKMHLKLQSLSLDKKSEDKSQYDVKLLGHFACFQQWLGSGLTTVPYPMINSLKLTSSNHKENVEIYMQVRL